jgi:hypothetical protein
MTQLAQPDRKLRGDGPRSGGKAAPADDGVEPSSVLPSGC